MSKRNLFLSAFVMICTYIFGQNVPNSPYSRIGIGDISDQNYMAVRAMGGIGTSFIDPYQVNFVNPASLSYLSSTAFDLGLNVKRSVITDQKNTANRISGGLEYISLAFPTKNPINQAYGPDSSKFKWSMGFNLRRNSQVGYDVVSKDTIQDFGEVQQFFKGSGGTYKVQLGNAIRYKDFAFGVNIGYLFGNIKYERSALFADLENAFNNVFFDDYTVSGFDWSAGFIYNKILNQKQVGKDKNLPTKRLTLGMRINGPITGRTKSSIFHYTEQEAAGFLYRDTIKFTISPEAGKMYIPMELAFGIFYSFDEKQGLGLDFSTSNWAKYRNDASREVENSQGKSTTIAFGGFTRPNYKSYTSYWKRVYYRYGVYYKNDPRIIGGEQIQSFGVNFGLGLPFVYQRGFSFGNIGVELGRSGVANKINETFGKINFGFTFNDDNWFIKRKYN